MSLKRRLTRLEQQRARPKSVEILHIDHDGITHRGKPTSLQEAKSIYHDNNWTIFVAWAYRADDPRRAAIETIQEAITR